VIEVAAQAGHAPPMNLDTCQHAIDELDSAERVPAEEQIRRTRRASADPDVPVEYSRRVFPFGRQGENRSDK
jgi:hypothetical protein